MAADDFESPNRPTHLRHRLRWLVVVHAVGLVVPVAFALPRLPTWDLITSSLAFAQITLLGIWLGFGGGRWRRRLLVTFGGASIVVVILEGVPGTLGWALRSGLYEQVIIPLTIFTTMNWLSSAAGIVMMRRWGPRLQLTQMNHETPRPAENFQFSIRGLMIAVLVTAVALSAAQLARSQLPFRDSFFRLCVEIPLFAIYCAAVSVTWVWAALGVSHRWLRMATALGLQTAICAVSWFALSWPAGRALREAAGMSVATLIVIASLLIVRSAGYRVVASDCAVLVP